MKAIIKVLTAAPEFTPDQIQIMKRISMVLIEHNLSVDLSIKKKVKTSEPVRLTIVR